MAKLINLKATLSDSWQLLSAAAAIGDVPPAGDVIVPLALWAANRDTLNGRGGRTGVWLDAADRAEALGSDVAQLPLIAVNFPKFSDGRGFTTGRLLRERHGFKGELRAIGDILQDQLFFLRRCGFDTFALRDDQDVESALAAFGVFSDGYQASVEQPQPLFRRRLAATK